MESLLSKIVCYSTLFILVMVMSPFLATARADYIMKIASESVAVHISGDLLQAVPNPSANNTAGRFGSLPVFTYILEGQNSSAVSNSLDTAIRELSPHASSIQPVLNATSDGTSFHYDLRFNVTGVSVRQGDVETLDLAWRSFAVKEELKAGNVSLNRIFPDYLWDKISSEARIASSGPPNVQRRSWFWNELFLQREEVASTTNNLLTFNFSALKAPLQSWDRAADVRGPTYFYRSSMGFNLTEIIEVSEFEETARFAKNAVYKLKTTVEAPWGATASGNVLIIEAPGAWGTWIMLASIILCTGVLGATILAERRLLESRTSRKSKGPRRH